MKKFCLIGALVAVMTLGPLAGSSRADDKQEEAGQAGTDEAQVPAGETVVVGQRVPPGTTLLSPEDLLQAPGPNIGRALLGVPGVSGVRRAVDAVDPVFRGLSGERVSFRVGGIPLHGACPSRMDPGTVYLEAGMVQQARVISGVPSVIHGPVGLAGGVELSLDYERPAGAEPGVNGLLTAGWDFNRAGGQMGAALMGGNRHADLRATVGMARLGDYTSGGGLTVPAGLRQVSTSASLGLRPAPGHRLWQVFVYRNDSRVDYPALPMDNIDTDFWLYNFGYRVKLDRGIVRGVRFRGGLSWVDHLMDNRYKSNHAKMQASTPAETRTYAAAGIVELRPAAALDLDTGVDFSYLASDARRTRTMALSGKSFTDHVWPNTHQWDLGAFVEARWKLQPRLNWRNGARVDLVQSLASGADSPSLGGKTVAQQYARFYGAEASDIDRLELSGALNTLLSWIALQGLKLHLGGGLAVRPASVTERYFAFGPAPGGFLVGNPSLAAEKRVQVEAGLSYRLPRWLELRAAGHYSVVLDYVLRTGILRQDVNGDGVEDVVRGFENITAQLAGADLGLTFTPLSLLTIPVTLSYVRGWNTSDGRALPEIPPLHGSASARIHWGERYRVWGEVGVRWAAGQTLVDPEFPEPETPAWAVLDLRAGARLFKKLWLTLAIENLLDADYAEHLTREVVLPTGGLKPGDKVPAPGRTVLLSLRGEI